MKEREEISSILAGLRAKIQEGKNRIQNMDDLLLRRIEREVGLWEFDADELEEEMWNRYQFLDKHSDPEPEIRSLFPSGRDQGKLSSFKKLFRWLTGRYTKKILDRQNRLIEKQSRYNKESVAFQLAAFLSLKKMRLRLQEIEVGIQKISRVLGIPEAQTGKDGGSPEKKKEETNG